MSALNKVVSLNQGTVFEDIQTFLNAKGNKSENTKREYGRSIREFFTYMRNKDIENLIPEDLKFRNADVLRYQSHLSEKNSNNTVNTKLAAIYSLYDFLERNEYGVRSATMKVDKLPEDGEKWGELSYQEAEIMSELVLKQKKGFEKSMLIKLSIRTGFRKSELLSLTWDNFKKDEENGFYLITIIGKGNKKNTQPLSVAMYEELLKIKELKYYKRYNDNRLFHITEKTVFAMLETLKEEMHIPASRNIVFHSFRQIAGNYVWETTQDITKVRDQLNHSNINTTFNHYMNKDKDYSQSAGLLMDEHIGDDIFDDMSREELLTMVKNMKNGVMMTLKNEAKKMKENR